jgi:hypothetical protein
MPVKAIGPKISEESAAWLEKNFKNLNAGATYILDAFPGLYARTLHDLAGNFPRGELLAMVDVMNATWLTPGIAGQHLAINVRDGIELDHLDQKWEIDGKVLNRKLTNLSIFALACLEIWIGAFWKQENHDNLEDWVKQFIQEGKQ